MIRFLLETLLIASLVSGGVWWLQRWRRRRLEARRPVVDLSTVDLIGITGVLDVKGDDDTTGQIRLRDHAGVEHVLDARVEDAEEPLELGAEVLVIQNPTPYAPMVVVPHDLPRLEDLPKCR